MESGYQMQIPQNLILRTLIVGLLLFSVLLAPVISSFSSNDCFIIELTEDFESEAEGNEAISKSEIKLFSNLNIYFYSNHNTKTDFSQSEQGLLLNPPHKEVLTPPPEMV